MRPALITVIVVGFVATSFAQSRQVAFEVASVHLLEQPAFSPDRITGDRVDLTRSLSWLVRTAFRLQDYQLSAPADLNQVYIELHATLPTGVTPTQVPEMLQALLAERFGLTVHREQRPTDLYELVVAASGAKVIEVQPQNDLKREFPEAPSRNQLDTITEGPTGPVRTISIPGGVKRITSRTMYERTTTPEGGLVIDATRMSIAELISVLQPNVDLPLIDNTGLAGVYQFRLELPFDPVRAVLIAAQQDFQRSVKGGNADQVEVVDRRPGVPARALDTIGLKLERRKMPIEVVVIDKISRAPTTQN